jgi:NitT/TauT family transport system substrate-binding protein
MIGEVSWASPEQQQDTGETYMKILAALLLVVLLATPARAEDAVSFRLNWYMGGAHAPFFLGKERGYYREAGIDLTINEGRGSANTAQVVAAGTDTFGLADSSSVMRLVSKDAPIRTVMSLLNVSAFGVISLAETGIQTPKDLEGKKLAITAGDALTQLFPAFAGFNKLDTSKITLVQIDPAGKIVALLEKRVDAILGGLDEQFFIVKQKGFTPAGLSFAKNGANTVGLTILTQDATIAAKPDLVRRFVAATQRSWQAAKAEPDAAIAALLKAKPGLDSDSQKSQLVTDLPNLFSPATEGKPIGWGALSDWEATEKLLKQYGNLETDKPATAFFTNDYLPK